jgi:hypothetical protein
MIWRLISIKTDIVFPSYLAHRIQIATEINIVDIISTAIAICAGLSLTESMKMSMMFSITEYILTD